VLSHNLPLLGTSFWTAIAVASGLTQIGKLSFVLVQVACSSGMVAENVFSTTLAASLISILLTVFIVRGTVG
jgi:Kef-type K+ transport system membrane component KefB